MNDLPVWPGLLDLESSTREEVQATPEIWATETPPQKRERICAHCGRVCGDYEGGFASYNGEPLCHPNEESRPDCYRLVQYGHSMPCLKCFTNRVTDEYVDLLLEVKEEQ